MAVKIFCVILLDLIYSTGDFFSILILFHIVYLITGLPIKDETSETTLRNIFSLCFLIFMILCNCKLVCFCTKSFNKPLDNYIYKGRILIINLRILTFQSFLSSLQSHPLWVTLYVHGRNVALTITYLLTAEHCMTNMT